MFRAVLHVSPAQYADRVTLDSIYSLLTVFLSIVVLDVSLLVFNVSLAAIIVRFVL